MEKSVSGSGPGRKGWTVALTLGALGLIGASAGVTAVLMNRPPPPPPPPAWAPSGQRESPPPPPPGMQPPAAEARPLPGAPQAVAEPPRVPGTDTAPAEAAVPSEPRDAGTPMAAEPKEAEAAAAQPTKPKPSEPHPRAPKLVPAEHVAMMKPSPGDYFIVPRGRSAGLTEGMVLRVVAAPVKDGKARLLGEATVMEVKNRRSLVDPDARVRNAGQVDRFVVLPKAPTAKDTDEDSQPEPTPPPPAETVAEEKPAEPRQLSGRIALKSIGPFVQKIELTNTDTTAWSGCMLVARGRDVYKLDDMPPGSTREVPLSGFEKGGRDVPFVGKNRLGLFCSEGKKEFPAKL